jgi:hypothetical protein
MSILFQCSACERKYEVKPQLAGKQVRCDGCGHIQQVIEPAAPAPVPREYALLPALAVAQPAPLPLAPQAELPRAEPRESIRWAIFEESRLQALASGLLLLGAIDLFLTFTLLRKSPAFFESNPVAQWFFARWNMTGMVMFKFSTLAVAIAVSEIIERRRPGLGKFVLLIGWLGTAYAIYKGYTLNSAAEPIQLGLME